MFQITLKKICVFLLTLTSLSTYSYPTFEEFQILYNKSYSYYSFGSKSIESRKNIYQQNLDFIIQHNSNPNRTYTLDINKWADLSWEEFSQERLSAIQSKNLPPPSTPFDETLSKNIPNEWDWRVSNTVSEIQDQGKCGSCWAFAAVSAIEQKVALKHNKLYKFSEQQLVDCVRKSMGCRGGYMDSAYEYVIRNRLAQSTSYPYTGSGNRVCTVGRKGILQIRGYGWVRPTVSPQSLQNLASQHVLSIGINANQAFRFYKSGIFNGPCEQSINHAVNIVGYTSNFWIIRNSWGKDWGENGYMKLSRTNGFICGIERMVHYAIL